VTYDADRAIFSIVKMTRIEALVSQR